MIANDISKIDRGSVTVHSDVIDAGSGAIITAAERNKLGTVEDNAKDDQTSSEIEALYEGISNTNKFTDLDKSKTDGLDEALAIEKQISSGTLASVTKDAAYAVLHEPTDLGDFGIIGFVKGDILKKLGTTWRKILSPVPGVTVIFDRNLLRDVIFFDDPTANDSPQFLENFISGQPFSVFALATDLPGTNTVADGILLTYTRAGGLTTADINNAVTVFVSGTVPYFIQDTVSPERSGIYNLIVNDTVGGTYTFRRDYRFRKNDSFTDGRSFFIGISGGDVAENNFLFVITQQFEINTDGISILLGNLSLAALAAIVATEEFANTNARFRGELGVPSSQPGWVDSVTGPAIIDTVIRNVLGVVKQVVRHFDDGAGLTNSVFNLSAADWVDTNANGSSFSGREQLDTVSGFNGFFAGFQADAAENPLATGNRRYGILFNNDGGNLRVTEPDTGGTTVTFDGTGGNPQINFDDFFDWECRIPAGLGAAQFFINDVLTTFAPEFRVNGGGLGTKVTVGSGSSGGVDRIVYHDNFGVTIYKESSTKILTAADLSSDSIKLFIPEGVVDYTITLPTGITRKQGASITVFASNTGTVTFNSQDNKSLFNELKTLVISIDQQQILELTNTVEANNIYSVKTLKDSLHFAHSGVVSVALDSLTIVDAGPATPIIRAKDIQLVRLRKRFDKTTSEILFMQPPQTDFAVPVGINFVYVTAQGLFRFGSDAPTADAVTKEILIGKVVNPAGTITSLVFTPVTTPGSVIQKTELIEAGGRKLTKDGGTITGGGGVDRTVQNVGKAFHEQLGRAVYSDPDASDRPFIPAIGIIGSVGSNSVLSTAHKLIDGSLSIDTFQVNAALPQIDTANFNNNGTLQSLNANKWVALHVIAFAQSNVFVFYTGLVEYGNQQLARDGFMSEDFEVLSGSLDGSHIGTLLCEANTTTEDAAFLANTIEFITRNGRRS